MSFTFTKNLPSERKIIIFPYCEFITPLRLHSSRWWNIIFSSRCCENSKHYLFWSSAANHSLIALIIIKQNVRSAKIKMKSRSFTADEWTKLQEPYLFRTKQCKMLNSSKWNLLWQAETFLEKFHVIAQNHCGRKKAHFRL